MQNPNISCFSQLHHRSSLLWSLAELNVRDRTLLVQKILERGSLICAIGLCKPLCQLLNPQTYASTSNLRSRKVSSIKAQKIRHEKRKPFRLRGKKHLATNQFNLKLHSSYLFCRTWPLQTSPASSTRRRGQLKHTVHVLNSCHQSDGTLEG